MEIRNIFWGQLFMVTSVDHNYYETTRYYKKVDYILFYNNGKCAIDIIYKKKYPFSPSHLDVGRQFVDIDNMVPFTTFLDEVEKTIGLKIDINMKVSRRKIIKILEKIGKEVELKEIEKEKVKKLIIIKK